jgi:hypothetical protein
MRYLNLLEAQLVAASRELSAPPTGSPRGARARVRALARRHTYLSTALALVSVVAASGAIADASGLLASPTPNGIYPPTPPAGTQSVTVACANRVIGPLPRDWRSPSNGTLAAGPIAWPGARWVATAPPTRYALQRGLAPGEKALAVVNAGAIVRVSIPASERARLSLNYTYIPNRGQAAPGSGTPLYRLADGASNVTFKACPPQSNVEQPSEFAGSFIVAGAQCARIDIYTSTRNRPLRRQIPFGVPARSCPATG